MRNNTHRKSKKFQTIMEAADHIHRHRSTLDKWRAENIVLAYYKDNGKIWYATADLDNYLRSCRVEPIAYGIRQRHVVS